MDLLYNIFIEPLQYEFLRRAMIASILVGLTSGLVGAFIMLRKMAMIGDALSHAVLPGVIIGFMFAGKNLIAMFIGAVISGIITSLLIGFVNRNSKIKEDTSIGVIFTGVFALGILLSSTLKEVHLDLNHYLFGEIIGVSRDDIILSGIIGLVVLISVILFYKQLLVTSFDPTMAAVMGVSTALVHYLLMSLLSMTIVASLQSVGVILVVAMLITPAATAYLLTHRLHRMLIYSVLISMSTAMVGLLGSYHLNFASGASMVVFGTFVFLMTLIFSPSQGILIKYFRRKRTTKDHLKQDILKAVFKFSFDKKNTEPDAKLDIERIAKLVGTPYSLVASTIEKLKREGSLVAENGFVVLTDKGTEIGSHIIRSHRLWESYLNDKTIMENKNIHSNAEEYEHILTDEILDEIDEALGYPKYDPSGLPIPQKLNKNSTGTESPAAKK